MKRTFKSVAVLTALGFTFAMNAQAPQTSNYVSKFGTAPNVTNSLIYDNGTNVGIGTTAPQQKLHIHNGELLLSGSVAGVGGPMIMWGTVPTAASWGLEYVTGTGGGLNFWRPWSTGNVNPGNNFLFLADATGNVGINTNNTPAKLTVNGKALIGDPSVMTSLPGNYSLYVQNGILTEKVRVSVHTTASWADYVFSDTYKLKSIHELESYLKENKHLPGVPSAEEVVTDGVDMAAMDAKLLEKIEELSLYIIAQNKRIEQLENKLSVAPKN